MDGNPYGLLRKMNSVNAEGGVRYAYLLQGAHIIFCALWLAISGLHAPAGEWIADVLTPLVFIVRSVFPGMAPPWTGPMSPTFYSALGAEILSICIISFVLVAIDLITIAKRPWHHILSFSMRFRSPVHSIGTIAPLCLLAVLAWLLAFFIFHVWNEILFAPGQASFGLFNLFQISILATSICLMVAEFFFLQISFLAFSVRSMYRFFVQR